MLFKRNGIRVIAIFLAFSLFAFSPVTMSSWKAEAKTLSELQKESAQLEKEAQQLQKKINAQEKNIKDQKSYKSTLDIKISTVKKQIELLDKQMTVINAEISRLNTGIADKEQEISKRQANIDERYEMLCQRLRAISKSGNLSVLQMLLDSDSYTDYLIKSKIMESIAESDQTLMNSLEKEIQAIKEEKDKLDKDKASVLKQQSEVEALTKDSNAKKAELDVLYGKVNKVISNLNSNLKDYKNDLEATEEQMKKLDKEITALINANSSNGKYGGSMFWPVPAVRAISSYYGWRWGKLHRGIDIANGRVPVYGQNIVAAASGKVIYANKTSTWGGGYGYYLIIDHGKDSKGNTISTLYAHCSKILISNGQTVVGGQPVIAKAGDTGNVTGPHLHFEVRVNGTAVDPIKNGYVKL